MGGLKHSFVVSVACGERHSVALTRLGEIYCWGDNKKGQLGVINVSDVQVSSTLITLSDISLRLLFVCRIMTNRSSRFISPPTPTKSLMDRNVSRVFGRQTHVEGRSQYLPRHTPLLY
jgi:hypothetical protein